MPKLINSIPKKDGYLIPAEFEKHKKTYILWPQRTDNWRNGAKPAQKIFAKVINEIAKFEDVVVGVNKEQYLNALNQIGFNKKIKIIEISNNDSWIRDSGGISVKNKQNITRLINFKFNAWGGLDEGLYFPWDLDDTVPIKMANIENLDYYNCPFVLEGGSILSDGKGILFTTKECLLNKNRNPNLNKKEIEEYLKNYLGVSKIIWLNKGVYNDETNGHVDNIITVCPNNKILLAWTDDKNDPQYKISNENYEILKNETDVFGNKFEIIKIHIPTPLIKVTKEESEGVDSIDGTLPRNEGDRQATSYNNAYICNNLVMLPIFNCETDNKAISIFVKVFPNRNIIPILAREIALGGGNVHCITMQLM